MGNAQSTVLPVAGREVVVMNPDKLFFPQAGHTKLDLMKYYAAVAEGALRGIAACPIVLKRYVDGAEGEPFFQKRAPAQRPEWVGTVELRFPSGRTAREIVVRDAAQLLWIVNLGCIDLNPHPVRADDLSSYPPRRKPPVSATRPGLRTTGNAVTSRRASRRHVPASKSSAAAAAGRRTRSSSWRRPSTRRTRSPASNAGRPGSTCAMFPRPSAPPRSCPILATIPGVAPNGRARRRHARARRPA